MLNTETLNQNVPITALFSDSEILSALMENGIVDTDGVQEAMNKKMLNYVTSCHSNTIWEGDDGRWRTYVPDVDKPKGRRLVSRETNEALISMLFDFYKGDEYDREKREKTMEDLFPEWQEHKRFYVTAATIRRDKTTWNKLYADEPITKKPICELKKEEIEKWVLSKIHEKNMDAHQYNNFSSIIRQLLDYAEECEIVDSNPFSKVRIHKRRVLRPEVKKASEQEVFSAEERDALIKYAFKQYELRRDKVQIFTPLAIAFLLYVGLRRGEITPLKFSDIDGKQIILSDSYSHDMNTTKGRLKDGKGWRNVYVVPPALEIIEKVRQERERLGYPTDGYIFCVDDKLDSFYSSIGKMINKYCKELGIPQRGIHKTRKTVASMMHASGIDDLIIQKQLGHKDVTTTQRCYCYDLSTDDERYEKISQSLS